MLVVVAMVAVVEVGVEVGYVGLDVGDTVGLDEVWD